MAGPYQKVQSMQMVHIHYPGLQPKFNSYGVKGDSGGHLTLVNGGSLSPATIQQLRSDVQQLWYTPQPTPSNPSPQPLNLDIDTNNIDLMVLPMGDCEAL